MLNEILHTVTLHTDTTVLRREMGIFVEEVIAPLIWGGADDGMEGMEKEMKGGREVEREVERGAMVHLPAHGARFSLSRASRTSHRRYFM